MKKFLRRLALAVVAAGAVMLGYAASEGYRRGFGFDLEYGNWDPVIVGVAGVLLLAAGGFAYAYFGHPEAGVRRRTAFLATLRLAAVAGLAIIQGAAVAGGIYGLIMAAALSHAGQPAAWAGGLASCAAVAWWCASRMTTWFRTPPAPKDTSVAPFDDSDG